MQIYKPVVKPLPSYERDRNSQFLLYYNAQQVPKPVPEYVVCAENPIRFITFCLHSTSRYTLTNIPTHATLARMLNYL